MVKRVILFHDGAIDELMSVALLMTMRSSSIEYLGSFVVNGDCLAGPTVEVQHKILDYMTALDPGLPDGTFVLPVGSRAVNAFPWTYRQYSMMANLLPALNRGGDAGRSAGPAPRLANVAAKVRELAAEPGDRFTILSLGPLTPIADLVDDFGPGIRDLVEEIIWMGGAVPPEGGIPPGRTIGNIDTGIAIGANPNAEWNAYWDPYAVDTVFRSGIPIRLFPLNVTNDYPLDAAFFERYVYPNAGCPMIDLAGQMYSTVAFETGYCFWDTVTTAYLGKPDLFGFEPLQLGIDTDFASPDFGSLTRCADGVTIHVARQAEKVEAFYDYYVAQLRAVTS